MTAITWTQTTVHWPPNEKKKKTSYRSLWRAVIFESPLESRSVILKILVTTTQLMITLNSLKKYNTGSFGVINSTETKQPFSYIVSMTIVNNKDPIVIGKDGIL